MHFRGSSTSRENDPRVRYCAPSGLYKNQNAAWSAKLVKKMVWERKLAPFFPAIPEDGEGATQTTRDLTSGGPVEECPLCMLMYQGGLNSTLCCRKRICSECILQVQNPPGSQQKDCPFCLRSSFVTEYRGVLTEEEVRREKEEQEKVERLQKAMAEEEREKSTLRLLSTKTVVPAMNVFEEKKRPQEHHLHQQMHVDSPQPLAREGKEEEEEEQGGEEEEREERGRHDPDFIHLDDHDDEDADLQRAINLSLSLVDDW